MSRTKRHEQLLGTELSDLPSELRWREWMGLVEAPIFAKAEPATRETLVVLVGCDTSQDVSYPDYFLNDKKSCET
ncbi:hypothetical protein [Rhizobium sp. GR12]|uniref:hypothetical protein n=1 Tax=Rhizobium sp. GR12 TaxID=3053925 RepID=UPI002FBDAFD0